MKKITIALLLAAGCCYIIVACHKPDIPRKKQCQIKLIEGVYHNSPFLTTGFITNHAYTNKRLLDSITFMPNFTAVTPVNVKISYNNKGIPVEIRDNANNIYKLIYQNGRVVRVDKLGTDNLFHTLSTFVYDSLGRIIESLQGVASATRWEYQGNSKNYIRKLIMFDLSPQPGLEIFTEYKYQYDDKVNPMNTWPNTTLVPFYFELVENSNHRLEPIPENNWVYQSVSPTQRGFPLLAREHFYTYEYDDVYPVKYDLMLISHNPFIGRRDTTRGTTTLYIRL